MKYITELTKKLDYKTFNKESIKKQHRSHDQFKQSLKDTALFERSMMNMSEVYSTSSKENREYI